MPSNSKEYNRKNYKKYWGNPKTLEKIKKRVQARRIMMKAWKVKKFDGKDVDHRKWTEAWNWKANLRVISALKNRIDWQKKWMKQRKKNWTTTYNKT